MRSPYRDTFRIQAYTFGTGDPSVAIVGAMRGDEFQQQYICARMIRELKALEEGGHLAPGRAITVIPSCNPFSMNAGRRFWVMDGTDINRMFPGYDRGETTQRIAAALFEKLRHYTYGIQLASFYVPGSFLPHVRLLRTGYEDIEGAKLFGLDCVSLRSPRPFDTTLLNYNWQIWDTHAYSLYPRSVSAIDEADARNMCRAIRRFLGHTGHCPEVIHGSAYVSTVVDEDRLVSVRSESGGFFVTDCAPGDQVEAGAVLAHIVDPYEGSVRQALTAPVAGRVFFIASGYAVMPRSPLVRLEPVSF